MEFNEIDPYFSLSNDKLIQQRKREEILATRFKIVLLYPNCEFKIHDIIKPNSNIKIAIYRSFPKIFKELKWWEDRDITEMPKYVKSDKYGIMACLIDFTGKEAIIEDNTGSRANFPFESLMPACEFEYLNFIKKQQNVSNK